MSFHVAIIGAGLGGLAAALFLRAREIDVSVYEQGGAFQDVGAGIVIAPNMVRPLQRLGIASGLEDFALRLDYAWEFRRWRDGQVIASTPMREACIRLYGAPCYVAHRADIRAYFRWHLPEDVIHLDRRCVAVTEGAGRVELEFQSADGDRHRTEADAVIAADGIRSALREKVTFEDPPRFSGLCAFRCLVPVEHAPEIALRPSQTLWLGPGHHFVHYPISSGRLINVVAVAPAGDWRSESWTADGEIDDFMREFAGWDQRVHQLITSATQTKRWAAFDRCRCSAGRQVALRCLATPPMPCCLSSRKARRSVWKTPKSSPPFSPPPDRARWRRLFSGTKRCGGRAPTRC
jgi:salicylate hydroxylase